MILSCVYLLSLLSIIHYNDRLVKRFLDARKFLNIFPSKISETVKYGCYLCVNRSLRVLRGYCYTSRGVILYYIITEIYILVQVDRVACRCYSITLYLNVVTSLEVVTLHSLYPCAAYLCTKGTGSHKNPLSCI